eukprot:CAMPEP_0170625960 /NCGR_PEP_ID=MMETSP0224-20130122/31068_1 /TAXON_ID=285029 /ORGANISM="Togula jolla, Strain CCCM 725" /LENGTH=85 /DNA_ID=CAMNT_0010952631 /DNA_START=82 /DNA_END=339 /DNA_ORIENTATION=-
MARRVFTQLERAWHPQTSFQQQLGASASSGRGLWMQLGASTSSGLEFLTSEVHPPGRCGRSMTGALWGIDPYVCHAATETWQAPT